MRVLALDTTTRAGSVAVLDGGRVLAEHAGDGARTQAERLPGEILDVLATASLRLSDIDLFAVASGPGSFTGIRIGIACIQGLATVQRRPVAAVTALRALGEAAAAGLPAGTRVGAWMDAHRREVFTALYDVVEPATPERAAVLAAVEEAMVSAPALALARWLDLGLPSVLCGDGAVQHAGLVRDPVRVLAPPPLASHLARLAPLSSPGSPAAVQPFYVRRPDVELTRDAAAARR
ncbi:MAG: tRNA (adenosine(37)-N6)-threonylcarbamoyltransferase complex dimerization subunit type 1 TsaB [Vicinamibacterales bacterium]